jgi:DNA-binding MarR family transcriptional regulator
VSEKLGKIRLDEQLCFALYAATHAITRIYRPLLAELNITYPQYIVLLVLIERSESTVNGIAEALKLDAATVTPLLKRLAQAGLITRERNRADERVVVVRLTPQGRSLELRLADVQNTVRCRTGLDVTEFTNLRDTLEALTNTLSVVHDLPA